MKKTIGLLVVVLAALLLPSRTPRAFQTQAPVAAQAVNFAETGPVAEIRENSAVSDVEEEIELENCPAVRTPIVASTTPDGALQSSISSSSIAAPLTSFDGLSSQDNFNVFSGRVSPPDTNLDVGPNHIVQVTNLLARVFNKSGTPLTAPFKMSSLFAPLGGICSTN